MAKGTGERAWSRARFDDDVRIGPPEFGPPLVERPRDHLPKKRADLGARDERSAAPAGGFALVETLLTVVQRSVHEFTERKRPFGLDPGREPRREWRLRVQTPNAAVKVDVVRSPKRNTTPGTTPIASVAAAVSTSANARFAGTTTGVVSPSGLGSIHMTLATFA